MSDVAFAVFSSCFLVSIVANGVIVLTRRSMDSLYRVAINLILILLFFPTRTLGVSLKERNVGHHRVLDEDTYFLEKLLAPYWRRIKRSAGRKPEPDSVPLPVSH